MIYAKELKIGNLILAERYFDQYADSYVSLKEGRERHKNGDEDIIQLFQTQVVCGIDCYANNYPIIYVENGYCGLTEEEVCGVTLTEDWMLKLGFKITVIYPKNELHPDGWIVYEKNGVTITSDFRWNAIGDGVEIKYIHKLQNFYCEMTGQYLN